MESVDALLRCNRLMGIETFANCDRYPRFEFLMAVKLKVQGMSGIVLY